MPAPQIAFTTPASAPAWKRWLIYSAFARIVIFAIVAFATGRLVVMALKGMGVAGGGSSPMAHPLGTLAVQLIPAIVAYFFLVKLIERRRMSELEPRELLPLGAHGLLIGTVLISVVVGVLWLVGSYHVTGINPAVSWIPALLVVGFGAGIGEEIVTRGVLFRIVEEGLGTWGALIISALFFGAAHINNPGATLWSSAAIAIEAGLLLAMLYHVTRSLWVCMGMHAAWNVLQGSFYGVAVSGFESNGFLVSHMTGPEWLSGGAFGAEASVVALATCTTLTIVLLFIALRRHTIVKPSWTRRRLTATASAS
ncbi:MULTISPECIES: CPBP family intramembrane glutamic endopeptidase [Dyella]|uniref:CPBP family intramembrane metalloprotease n=2 Tax=Dyella TaxID=231454 RepID=A0A4R0YXT2_9GAMM|nr:MULTISPECIES: type II CAAX endopeptidase family protein [Dyella]TBR40314.1 CPBP family intramembrane metalloprotease [Dyella terrae]TCI12104.1 CPBP family intramembrane metalloprotease [Dyella soli]